MSFLITSVSCKSTSGTFKDKRDNKTYNWIQIGNQIWMSDNLAYKVDSDGYLVYKNKEENLSKYGYLYDWTTANKVAPTGWHLPTDKEWKELTDFLIDNNFGYDYDYDSIMNSEYSNHIDKSGFRDIPSGYAGSNGVFRNLGKYGYWWTASEYNNRDAWFVILNYDYKNVYVNFRKYNKEFHYAVRCVKD